MALYRSDTGQIQVQVTGINLDTVSWDTMSAPSIAADNTYYHPGGMGPSQAAGGLATPTDITVTRAWTDTLYGLWVQLYNAVPLSTPMTVIYTPLNANRSVSVKPVTFNGVLTTCTAPEYSAASSSIQYFTLVMAPNESISQN